MKDIRFIVFIFIYIGLAGSCGFLKRKKNPTKEENQFPFIQFNSNKIPVYFSRQEGPVISVAVVFKGGKLNYSKTVEGIEYLALRMAIEGGSLMYSPAERRERASQLGARISLKTGLDHSALILTCPAVNLGRAWDFFVQAILNPSFDESVFVKVRDAHYRSLISAKTSTEKIVQMAETDSLFSGTVYGKEQLGSATAMLHYSLPEIKEYFISLCSKNHMAIVVCGRTDTATIRDRITQTLTNIPDGYLAPFQSFELSQNKCMKFFADAKLQTARCVFNAPFAGSAEGAQLDLGLAILSERMNATGMMHLSYGLSSSKVPFAWIQIQAENFGPALREFTFQMRSLIEEGFFSDEIEAKKEMWISARYFVYQDPAFVTEMISRYVSAGNEDPVLVWENALRQVGKNEIDRVFRKAFVGPSWIFAGDTLEFAAPIIPTFVK